MFLCTLGDIVLCRARLGEDRNPKSEVCFLLNVHCFHAVLKMKKLCRTIGAGSCLLFQRFSCILPFPSPFLHNCIE